MSARDDERLAERLRGGLEANAGRAPKTGEERPELEEARRVIALLERAGSAQREDLRSIAQASDPRELDRIRRILERGRARGRRGRERWWLAAAACAAVALIWFALARNPRAPAAEDGILLGSRLVLRSPLGAVAGLERFEWSYDLDPGGWFVVLVRDPRAESSQGELSRSALLFEPRWEPPSEQSARWPDEILWEVRAYDGTGRWQASAQAGASRSPR